MNNKDVIRRLLDEGVNKHNFAIFTELYPSCVYHSSATGDLRGDAHRQFVASTFEAFPDCRLTILNQFAEGDMVMTRWSMVATHRGKFMGIPATGRRILITGMCIDRVVHGKIVEEWEEWDSLGMMRQLGLVPEVITEELVAA